jgi:hypothetical protein
MVSNLINCMEFFLCLVTMSNTAYSKLRLKERNDPSSSACFLNTAVLQYYLLSSLTQNKAKSANTLYPKDM